MTNHIRELTPDPRNARRHTPRNVGQIVNAMHEVGAARSIVIDEDGVILAGNATIEAAAQAGIERLRIVDADGEEIIAVRRTGLTPEQKTRLALADNRAAELAEWDTDVLAELSAEVDLSGLWSDDELAALLGVPKPVADDPGAQVDRADELRQKWQTERGQLWQVGRHRLLCGDSTSAEDVARLMAGERAGAIVTDPPYNVGFDYEGAYSGQDDKSDDEYGAWLWSIIETWERHLREGAMCFVWQGMRNCRQYARWFPREWRLFAGVRGMTQFMPTPVQFSWDPVVFWQTPGDVPIQPKAGRRDYFVSNTATWMQDHQPVKGGHPCPRPLDAVAYVIDEFSLPGDIVLEPFAGSATTHVAAEQTDRICYGMEIEPKYVAVALERLTGLGLDARRLD